MSQTETQLVKGAHRESINVVATLTLLPTSLLTHDVMTGTLLFEGSL